MNMGVTQDSQCGPLLFNLFINDLCKDKNNCEYLMFFMAINEVSNCVKDDIDRFCQLVKVNSLLLNGKCHVMSFSLLISWILFDQSINILKNKVKHVTLPLSLKNCTGT